MRKGILYAVLIATSLYSCNEAAEQETSEATETVTTTEHEHKHSDDIVLNNGSKWTVDKDMMVYIRNMETDITTFNNEEGDYKQLASKLEGNIDLLTSNCTMEGQAHDELHKWLIPYMTMAEEFSEANDKEATEKLASIEQSFVMFNEFFE